MIINFLDTFRQLVMVMVAIISFFVIGVLVYGVLTHVFPKIPDSIAGPTSVFFGISAGFLIHGILYFWNQGDVLPKTLNALLSVYKYFLSLAIAVALTFGIPTIILKTIEKITKKPLNGEGAGLAFLLLSAFCLCCTIATYKTLLPL